VDRAWQRLREEVGTGRQAYVVCPRIGDVPGDEPEDADGAPPEDEEGPRTDRRPPLAVLDVAELLRGGPLAGLRLDVLHGRMTPEDKDATMRAFAAGETQVLVATTVVEVGVDVPNATVMVVMDADRFGVSQLHQLRGRVARGKHAGLCLLVTEAPTSSPTGQRLAAVAATSDGFELARLDLETRREGDVLGAAQSGRRSGIRLLSLLEDEGLIATARTEATALLATDRGLADHPGLAAEVAALATDERADYLEKA
jgi:ATP-dependent DNA helicase RecG